MVDLHCPLCLVHLQVYVEQEAVDDELVRMLCGPSVHPNALDVFVSVLTGTQKTACMTVQDSSLTGMHDRHHCCQDSVIRVSFQVSPITRHTLSLACSAVRSGHLVLTNDAVLLYLR